MSSQSTDNDAAIAAALAKEEQERADAELAQRMTGGQANSPVVVRGRPVVTLNCPGRHGLHEFFVTSAQRVLCNLCGKDLSQVEKAYGCMTCNFGVCDACYERGGPPPAPPYLQPPRPTRQQQPNNTHPQSQRQSTPPHRSPFSFPGSSPRFEPPTHMCIAPCVIGNDGVCIEMLVDTGAQTSVISLPLARQLGLDSRIDRTQQGVATGVGQARIIGRIKNVICELGHVEFPMDFTVLDVRDKILLLGLDLMRRYKCIVDLERDVLIFGGKGGVEVTLLPAEQQHVSFRNPFGCPMM